MYVDLDLFADLVREVGMPPESDPRFVQLTAHKIDAAEECQLDEDYPTVLAYAFTAYVLDEAIASVQSDHRNFRYIWP